jgi:hypothetical protein
MLFLSSGNAGCVNVGFVLCVSLGYDPLNL